MPKGITLSFLFLIVFVVFGTFTIPGYAISSRRAVVGIWLFDENEGEVAGDLSGNGHAGDIRGMQEGKVKWVAGKFDSSALEFPGFPANDSYVEIPHHNALNLTKFSVTAWINLPSTNVHQTLLGKGDPESGERNFYLKVQSFSGLLYGGFQDADSQRNNCISKDVVADAEWHHVAITYDQTKLVVFVDGKSFDNVVQGKVGGDPLQNTAAVTIGARNVKGGNPVNGVIDEVGIFNEALTARDIDDIMDTGLEEFLGHLRLAVGPPGKLAATWGSVKEF